jgi:methylase of polypeptide subunit release factors
LCCDDEKLFLSKTIVAGSFLPVPFFVEIILRIISAFFIILFFYMSCAYYLFAKNGNELQHDIHYAMIDKLSWNGEGKALDIGTGSGACAVKVAKKFPNSKITGIDTWGKAWSYAQKVCEKNAMIEGVDEQIIFQRASASNLPFEDGEFDSAVSNFVFHEVRDTENKRDVIREALRVIRKDGAFSFQDLFLSEKIYGEIEDLLKTIRDWGIEEVHFTSTADLVDIPRLLRVPGMLGEIGIIHGKK